MATTAVPFFWNTKITIICKKVKGLLARQQIRLMIWCIVKMLLNSAILSNFARYSRLSASFATCLKSNQTVDQVYVLEFFLCPDYVKGKNLRATLVPILETMRQRFKTFKFGSGCEIGDSVSVQVIDANFSENNGTYKIGRLYLMDNHLSYTDSIENRRTMASNLNEREFAITASTEKIHKAHKLGDRGRESLIGITKGNFSENPLPVANFVSTSRECTLSTSHNVNFSAEKENIAMQQRFISHDGTDVSRFFPEDFKKYIYEENLLCRNIRRRFWGFSKEHESGGVGYAPRYLTDGIYDLSDKCLEQCLVQYWIAEERGDCSERLFQLESWNQPFYIIGSDTYDRICSYRTKMSNPITGNGGVIGRVYRNNMMEYTPDVGYYSSEEYPQQDLAWFCGVKSSLVFPLCDFSGRPVGVCELVSPETIFPSEDLIRDLSTYPKNGLKWVDRCKDVCGQYDSEQISLQRAVSEIGEIMNKVGKIFELVYGQTWMLCKSCNSLCTSERCGEELGASYSNFGNKSFLQAESFWIFQKGEGVVGKAAATSHNIVYCENVAKFGVIEYPLAHLARKYNLSACFALCIKSNQTGDQVYVLEFFLDLYSCYAEGKNLREIFVPILEIMRQLFKSFKFASGGEIGDSLSVLVIDANSPDKVETLDLDLILTLDLKNDKSFDFLQNLERFGGRGESSRQSIGESSTEETDDTMIGVETSLQDISMEDAPVDSYSTVQCEIRVTINATYGVDSIIFQLSASSGIHELYHQVSQRLHLADGTFDLKYIDDENDLIELACDEDLQMYISSSTEQENYTLLVFVISR